MTVFSNYRAVLKSRPRGISQADHFEMRSALAPRSIVDLYKGKNLGKRLIRLAGD